MGVATMSFELRVLSDACDMVLGYLSKGKEKGQKKMDEIKQ
jgi:hypothetical protein